MARAQLGYFFPVEGPVDPGYGGGISGGHPSNELPPPPGQPGHPIIPGTPDRPIEAPPGTIWPPLPPSVGGDDGLVRALVAIQGYGHRWVVIDTNLQPDKLAALWWASRPLAARRSARSGERPASGGRPHPGNRPPGSGVSRPGNVLPPVSSAQPKK